MYIVIVVTFMLVLPLASIGIQAGWEPQGMLTVLMISKWFVFWAVGLRLLLAGLRQIFQPRYTAQTILGIAGAEAHFLVRELGFANVAIGSVASLSLLFPQWTLPLCLVGGIFYGLAGINHCLDGKRATLKNVAMTSDLFAAAVLLITGLVALLR
jgi:hypothetical protein